LQDKAVKAKIDAKNQLETYIYSVKSTVEDKAKVGSAVSTCYITDITVYNRWFTYIHACPVGLCLWLTLRLELLFVACGAYG
jgi:hypothetical protein